MSRTSFRWLGLPFTLSLSMVVVAATAAGCRKETIPPATVTLDTIPVVDISENSVTSAALIEYPNAATRLSNGNIVVNDLYGGHLLFFDPHGKLIRSFGRPGSGPGEFNVLTWRGVCAPDSIYATTSAMRDWVIDSAGRIARDEIADIPGHSYMCNRRGVNVYVQTDPMTHVPRPNDPPLGAEILIGRDTMHRKSLGRFVVWEYGPARPQMRVAMSLADVFLGSGESGRVKVFSSNGEMLREIDTGARRHPPTDSEYEASLDDMVAPMTDRDTRESNKAILRQRFPKPNEAAAFSALSASPGGLLWVTVSLPGDMQTILHVIAPDGNIGRFRLPVELKIFEVGDDYVLGSYEDAGGFPHVVFYNYQMSSSPASRQR